MGDNGRPWITCHVLDTAQGRPAAGIKVTLEHHSHGYAALYQGQTNTDGRVESWEISDHSPADYYGYELNHLISELKRVGRETSQWTLTFETRSYNKTSFFDKVTVDFTTDLDEAHYHVPLLLSPHSYTTYRGS